MSRSSQEEGLLGRAVGGMIRRSVRKGFHTVYWRPPVAPLEPPVLFATTHHGWYDGYLMYHVVKRLGLRSLDWITEFDAFPLFARVGGMPFPAGDAATRAATIRRTIRLMREERRSLVLFPEQHLHRPPEVWPLGGALELIVRKVPEVTVVPTVILYEQSLHQRPEAFVSFGAPVPASEVSAEPLRKGLVELLTSMRTAVAAGEEFEVLARGTQDVNERWYARRLRDRRSA